MKNNKIPKIINEERSLGLSGLWAEISILFQPLKTYKRPLDIECIEFNQEEFKGITRKMGAISLPNQALAGPKAKMRTGFK